MSMITIKDEEIFYSRSGNENSPYSLLFIHGAVSDHTSFSLLEKNLSDYNCVLIDMPAHGKSKGCVRHNVESSADFIEDFVAVLQERKEISNHLTLIGCSMGGFISLELALRKFSPLKRLILLSSGADPNEYSETIPYISESPIETFDPRPLLRISFSPQRDETIINSIISGMEYMGLPNSETSYYDFSTVKNFNKIDKVKDITLPTLAIIGDSDRIIPPICSFHLLERMPDCNLAVIPFGGHAVLLDACEYISSIVVDFLSIP